MESVIVSGKNSQLGQELQLVALRYPQFNFYFYTKEELDISNAAQLEKSFSKHHPAFFINCAAYTAVDKAETVQEAAYIINAESVGHIAKLCKKFNTTLIHISSDYVFDGKNKSPYHEYDTTNPINYYGYTKYIGEKLALENNDKTIIIRTSWVYSAFGQNFVKTMIRLMQERSELNVVNDQHGSPTYAKDLAAAILSIMKRQAPNAEYGIYHFSNEGIISWFDFACAIKELKHFDCNLHPVSTAEYPTPAKRPLYTALNKEKIVVAYHIQLRNWKESLKECLELL